MSKILDTIDSIIMSLAMLCVALIMFIVSYDAFARYAFGAPLPWTFDVISHFLLTASVFFAASMTFKEGDHINIDLFRPAIPRALRIRLDGFWCLLAAIAIGIMTYGSYKEAFKAWNRGSFLTGYILWPAWVPYALIALGCALLTIRLLVGALPALLAGRDTVTTHSPEELDQ